MGNGLLEKCLSKTENMLQIFAAIKSNLPKMGRELIIYVYLLRWECIFKISLSVTQ